MKKKPDLSTLEQMFRTISDERKLDFLFDALKHNPSLRNQFTVLFRDTETIQPETSLHSPEKLIADTAHKMKNQLELLDFDDMDWRDYIPRHSGYIEDYEAHENFADDHLEEIFIGWKKEILDEINNGQVLQAVCKCLGMYDACVVAEIPGSDDIFEDLTGTLLEKHQETLNESIEAIGQVVRSEIQAMASVEVVLVHYFANYREIMDFLQRFEPLLVCLTETGNIAEKIIKMVEATGVDESWVPLLALKIASFDKDPLIWREKAEEYMELSPDVARQLLDHYWTEDPECFRVVGEKLFREQPARWFDYFSELLYPKFDEAFYKEVLYYKTLRRHDIDLYNELRKYLNDGEKEKFAEEIIFNDAFKVSVLAIEKRYPEILKLARKELLHTWHFTEMITPILNIYPVEVFELIRIKCDNELRTHRKRSGYERIAGWLKLALQIQSPEVNALPLINHYYNRKPALPALKEEMRRVGVAHN